MRRTFWIVIQQSVVGVSILVFLWLLWEKLHFGLVRYFDADEMAYLHWAHSVYTGMIPYRDFLSYVPPGFYYALAPLYWITHGTDILWVGRVYAFGVFVGITVASMYLFWYIRKSWIAVLAGICTAFLPIPADKFIEIRPDNLAVLTAMMGSVFQIIAIEKGRSRFFWRLSGVLYMSSLLILPKTLPQVFSGLFVALCWWVWGQERMQDRMAMMRAYAVGLCFPLVIFGLWMLVHIRGIDQWGTLWYSLIRLPLEVNTIGALFPMEPYQFFYPNTLLYGADGWNTTLIANHSIWLVGLLVGAMRLVTPMMVNGKKGAWAEVMLGLSFFGYSALFIYGYPMRHEQYLIPIGIFVAWYAADAVYMVWKRISDAPASRMIFLLAVVGVLCGIVNVSGRMNTQKSVYTNAGDYRLLQEAIRLIPTDAYVFDLVGSTIYFRDPYYVSAVPFGQWEPYLSRPLPSVREALMRTQTGFVYEGQLKRTESLSSEDRTYIYSRFHSVPGISGLLVR